MVLYPLLFCTLFIHPHSLILPSSYPFPLISFPLYTPPFSLHHRTQALHAGTYITNHSPTSHHPSFLSPIKGTRHFLSSFIHHQQPTPQSLSVLSITHPSLTSTRFIHSPIRPLSHIHQTLSHTAPPATCHEYGWLFQTSGSNFLALIIT